MFRTAIVVALWALVSVGAQAGEHTCTQSHIADAGMIMRTPRPFVGKCIRARGVMSAAPKIGAMLTPTKTRPTEEHPDYIALYYENNIQPDDLDTHPRYAEIVGRVLTCAEIGKNAMEGADRANREEAVRQRAQNEPQTVYIGVPSGICHYKGDAFAILISSYKLLPVPPG